MIYSSQFLSNFPKEFPKTVTNMADLGTPVRVSPLIKVNFPSNTYFRIYFKIQYQNYMVKHYIILLFLKIININFVCFSSEDGHFWLLESHMELTIKADYRRKRQRNVRLRHRRKLFVMHKLLKRRRGLPNVSELICQNFF